MGIRRTALICASTAGPAAFCGATTVQLVSRCVLGCAGGGFAMRLSEDCVRACETLLRNPPISTRGRPQKCSPGDWGHAGPAMLRCTPADCRADWCRGCGCYAAVNGAHRTRCTDTAEQQGKSTELDRPA